MFWGSQTVGCFSLVALPSQLKAQRDESDPEGGRRHKGLNQHFLAQGKHRQVQASLSLVHLGHQTLEEDSAAVSDPGSTQGPGSSIPICCLIYECPDTVHNSARGAVGPAAQENITWLPDFMSFMFMAFFMPLPFSFLFFFFLQQHFLQMQKQQVRMRSPATTAMAMRAQGGTVGKSQCHGQPCSSLPATQKPCSTGCTGTSAARGGHQEGNIWERSYSQGILLSSFMNLSLSLVNMSSLLSPGPAASVEFSIVLMGSVLAVASGAIMDACLNVMVGQGLPETHHLSGHTGPCCPHSPPVSPGLRVCGQQGCTGTSHLLLEGHRSNVCERSLGSLTSHGKHSWPLSFLALDISKSTGSITQPCINDGVSSKPPRDNGDTLGRTFTWQSHVG